LTAENDNNADGSGCIAFVSVLSGPIQILFSPAKFTISVEDAT